MASGALVYPRFHYPRTHLLVQLLAGFLEHGRRPYVQVGQANLCRAFHRRFGIPLSRRHLNRLLADARKWGAIGQRRTHTRGPDGNFVPGVTLTWLQDRGWQLLRRVADNARSISAFFRVPSKANNRRTHAGGVPEATAKRGREAWWQPPRQLLGGEPVTPEQLQRTRETIDALAKRLAFPK